MFYFHIAICENPTWDVISIDKNRLWYMTSSIECMNRCRDDYRCADAFYLDLTPWNGGYVCVIYYDTAPCVSTTPASWFNPIHWKGTTEIAPTLPPSPTATPVPVPTLAPVPAPTRPPVLPPTLSQICDAAQELTPLASAGYGCVVNGVSVEDSNFGGTSASCDTQNGDWVEYDCATAESYLPYVGKYLNGFREM